MNMKKILTLRFWLSMFLLATIVFAAYSAYYKVARWGFSLKPKETTDIWTIEAHISFKPNGENIVVSMASPNFGDDFKVLAEDVVAKNYELSRKNNRLIMKSPAAKKTQHIYYRVLLYDNEGGKGKISAPVPPTPRSPMFDEKQAITAEEIWELSKQISGDKVQQIIRILNQLPPEPVIAAVLPHRKTPKAMSAIVSDLLSFKKIPNRLARGIKLEEDKKTYEPDLMLEAYVDGQWKLYNLENGKKGLPKNFIIFQKGGDSLLDVSGGEDSTIKFSVQKSPLSSFNLAGHRAKLADSETNFAYSIYSLPLLEQNTLKWFTIFPLSILIVVLIRNVIGMHTMGTFTPMLLSMSLVKTGFVPGMICFVLIVGLGFLLRALLSRLNLLLVPRISAVVIFVILIMQGFTIVGYRLNLNIVSSALFFPIIITAWIVERASITLEEEGAKDCAKELFNTLLAAVIVYFVISSEYIRHIMFAFNELNLVILALIMLLGTYTGYRLTELTRFASLIKEHKNADI